MKLIGTGFGRTGTDSMREALNMIGAGPCHHMREVQGDEAHRDLWRAAVAGDGPIDWDVLLDGYASCVDWPTAHYWPELLRRWPEAKVLLTWRDAESWWRSFEKTILPVILESTDGQSMGLGLIRDKVFGGRADDRDHAVAVYEANIARVTAEVPAERLLVYPVGSGWAPLCDFLGVPVPDAPFPRINSAAEFNSDPTTRPRAPD